MIVVRVIAVRVIVVRVIGDGGVWVILVRTIKISGVI